MGNVASKSFVKKLTGYATLAAAGLAVEPAMAGIISSGPGFVPVTIAPGEVKGISFGGSLGSLFQFNGHVRGTTSSIPVISAVIQSGANALPTESHAIRYGNNNPDIFGLGYLINAGLIWSSASSSTGRDIAGEIGYWNGPNGTTVRGFTGFRFSLPDGFHYGYFDVSYDNNPTFLSGTMKVWGWAYETTPDLGITTAATGAVPEPVTLVPLGLGLLALGAGGIRAKRKKAPAHAA